MERYFEVNEQGHNIRCKLYCNNMREIENAIIYIHGFAGHKDNSAAARFAEKLTSKHKKAALITFDLPCHGSDVKKKLYLQDCSTYLNLLVNYLNNRYSNPKLYVYATSFGGYLLLKYISEYENPFRRIVLRCPALNIYEAMTTSILTREDQEKLQKKKEILAGFDRKVPVSVEFLEELRAQDVRTQDFLDHAENILIVHGTKDEIIPYEVSKEFSENQLIELIGIEGADHRFKDVVKMDLASKRILEFLNL